MSSRMDNFRKFVSGHDLLREEVRNGKRTWQNIYEEWVLLGDENENWNKYKVKEESKKTKFSFDTVKTVYETIKKVDTDNLNKTLNNVQKVIQIAQTVTGSKGVKTPKSTTSFTDWWD